MRIVLKLLSKGVASVLLTVVTIVAVVSILTALNVARVRNELSSSMYPKIKTGDLVVYRPVRATALSAGEVISFMRPGDPVPITHRILTVNRHGARVSLLTKGDNNPTRDATPTIFPATQTVWRVATEVPHAGGFVSAVTGTHGVPFVLGLTPLFLSLPYIQRSMGGERRRGAHRRPRGLLSGAPPGRLAEQS